MSDEYRVTVYEVISSTETKQLATTAYFYRTGALVSAVKDKVVRTLNCDPAEIVFLNHHVAERDEGDDRRARRIWDSDPICMIDDYEGDAWSDCYVGKPSPARSRRFVLHYSVKTAEENLMEGMRLCDAW